MSKDTVTNPILLITDIIGNDFDLKYIDSIASEGGLSHFHSYGDIEGAMLISEYNKYESTANFYALPIKKLFHLLREMTGKYINGFSISNIIYGSSSSRYPSGITIRIELLDSNYVYLGIKSIQMVKEGIPEDYKKWVSEDGNIYISLSNKISFCIEKMDNVKDICNSIRAISLQKGMGEFEKPTVEIITMTAMGLDLREVEISGVTMSDESMNLHYGDGFDLFNKTLINEMGNKNKGVILLHGPPGNGKTYYIRHLISELRAKDKRVIIIPKHVLAEMESPQFNDFMIDEFSSDNEKAVFVVEDAESVLRARDSDGDSRAVVSTILNLSDGILNDIFKVQLICTFNTALDNIDEALLRPGRLLARKEFIPLDKNSANRLLKHIGNEESADRDMSLAEIYSSTSLLQTLMMY